MLTLHCCWHLLTSPRCWVIVVDTALLLSADCWHCAVVDRAWTPTTWSLNPFRSTQLPRWGEGPTEPTAESTVSLVGVYLGWVVGSTITWIAHGKIPNRDSEVYKHKNQRTKVKQYSADYTHKNQRKRLKQYSADFPLAMGDTAATVLAFFFFNSLFHS